MLYNLYVDGFIIAHAAVTVSAPLSHYQEREICREFAQDYCISALGVFLKAAV